MWRIPFLALLLAGCVQLPPTPEDIQAKRFDAVPGKSVIYIVRQRVGSDEGRSVTLDDRAMITTFKGTYYRWEVDPGTHRVAGFASGNESVTLTTAPGGVYFVQHTVFSDRRDGGVLLSFLDRINDERGRSLVSQAQLLQ
jgi:hypothetical protein